MKNDKIHLIGKYGEIKSINDTTCKAVITSGTIARSYLGKASGNPRKHTTVDFPVEELSTWIKRLEIYTTSDGNIKLASDFFE